MEIESVNRLANEFSKLPGVGKKTALRYAYYVIGLSNEGAKTFADAIVDVKSKVKFCEECGNYTESSPCTICKSRNADTICVQRILRGFTMCCMAQLTQLHMLALMI